MDARSDLFCSDDPDLIFPWWSFSKTVLATAALRLVGKGKLELDQRLPDRQFTLRQLLQHQAGAPNYSKLAAYTRAVEERADPWDVEDMLDQCHAAQPEYMPGSGWAYSNTGYLIVRCLIERAANDDLGSALQFLVFDPLEIDSVFLAKTRQDMARAVWGNENGYHPGWVYHGLLLGTAGDAVRFLNGLMTRDILSATLHEQMISPHHIGGPVSGRPWQKTAYGLGLMCGEMNSVGRSIGHSGGGPENVCAVYHFPDVQEPVTVAAFCSGSDEGVAENEVVELVV